MKKFTGTEIYELIPNRYPLMFLDSLVVEAGKRASGYKRLDEEDWFFKCHYPGVPVFPATQLVEGMTQVFISTFLPERSEPRKDTHSEADNDCEKGERRWEKEDIPMLIRIGEFRMKQALYPGDSIRLDAYLCSFKRGIAQGTCEAYKLPSDQEGVETLVTKFEVTHALPQNMLSVRAREHK